ncbi:MAG: bifunctional phosphoribosylaminoimidazolecarboxamide formyltransferase/IMP cyclohydrolase [Omnitrophica bacterium RBG_13_46_9]|nr:MAG: bifunctional phosphoribosylaminoimidazolecarboxamide formyltransferase/IMP cyclohydrolase [Omnitrophica bacterium RBG_13_46_9]
MVRIKRVLISVSDKTGIKDLAKTLSEFGAEILSTGGTAKKIKELGIPVKDVSEHTGFPEMMDGRVKTLHPKIHGGLLALRENKSHMDQAKKHDIKMIDMVVVNLYPFEKTVAKAGVTLEEAIENIDIGGPSMLRSAAKNNKSVAVITDPSKYPVIIKELKDNKGSLSESTLERLAVDVFRRTAEYDKAIFEYLNKAAGHSKSSCSSTAAGTIAKDEAEAFSDTLSLSFKKAQDLRYGENPHQRAAFYKDPSSRESGVCNAIQLQGKELSFNNILDLNAAIEIVKDFDRPAASIIKHTNPCGAAVADSLYRAYMDALECDRLSAFGSIVGLNGKVDKALAELMVKEADFIECIIAPSFDNDAREVLSKKKNLRLLEVPDFKKTSEKEMDYKKVVGGLLVQDMDLKVISKDELKVATTAKPSNEEVESLLFGWKIVKHVKSNAIVLCQGTKTVGIGAGQMSRVDSVIIACRKAGSKTKGATLASDAFFPKPDAITEAHRAGIKAIVQPGGSKGDDEIVEACNKYGISMVFAGARHFRH